MQKKKAVSIIDIMALTATICILALILMPVIICAKGSVDERCQSNMSRIGIALMMYANDWDDRYPTNRMAGPWSFSIAKEVGLSDPNLVTSTGDHPIFQYGINWVEALYPYLNGERAVVTADPCVWRCPAAEPRAAGNYFPATTYAFNANLIEKRKSAIHNPGKLMMIREMRNRYNAVLRPSNISSGPSPVPFDPFLDNQEEGMVSSPTGYKLHDEGSHILFADGSVKYFSVAYYMDPNLMGSPVCVWDSAESRWYNNPAGAQPGDVRIKAIAITP